MVGYFTFAFLLLILLGFGQFTKKNAFRHLNAQRMIKNEKVQVGEDILVTTIIENNKCLPISFLHVKEEIPKGLVTEVSNNEINLFFSIKWYERVRSTFKLKGQKRGVYLLKTMKISLGDLFGFSTDTFILDDYKEIVVYPFVKNINSFNLVSNSIQGDNIIRRWIYKDPIFIRGIREYNVDDRMKDIHWPSSLKANKLMVKEFDYSSDRELVIIFNAQCGEPYYSKINPDAIENGIELSVSLISTSLNIGIPAGLWTNAHILDYSGKFSNKIEPCLNSFSKVLELCARISSMAPKESLTSFISTNSYYFKRNTIYTILAYFLDKESILLLDKLKNSGICIKIIDISPNASLPEIPGIEKIILMGAECNE
jgi:uncharacterized protein (DUF58 family)